MPFDPDFTAEAKKEQVQIALTKEQVFLAGIAGGVVISLAFLAFFR